MENIGVIIVLCSLIISGLIFYERKKSDRMRAESTRRFWEREERSNFTRKKDISYLNYISIPLEQLPLTPVEDEELSEYRKTILNLSDKKILNLSGMTNTDLKLEYGVANLPLLTDYDNNYSTLINTLARWGARLFELNMASEALTVLEYGISIGTDISRNFYLLADYYRKMNRPDEIDRLIDAANKTDTIMKPAILKKLQEIRSYCN